MKQWQEEVLGQHPEAGAIATVYPISDIRKGMIFGYLSDPLQAVYHEQFVYQLGFDSFDPAIFTQAFYLLTEKHETLRSSFQFSGFREPVQVVWKRIRPNISFTDLPDRPAKEQGALISRFLEEERGQPFDFQRPPLWRVKVYRCGEQQIVYILQFHHAILDGWSVALLNTELNEVYTSLRRDPAFIPVPLHRRRITFVLP